MHLKLHKARYLYGTLAKFKFRKACRFLVRLFEESPLSHSQLELGLLALLTSNKGDQATINLYQLPGRGANVTCRLYNLKDILPCDLHHLTQQHASSCGTLVRQSSQSCVSSPKSSTTDQSLPSKGLAQSRIEATVSMCCRK